MPFIGRNLTIYCNPFDANFLVASGRRPVKFELLGRTLNLILANFSIMTRDDVTKVEKSNLIKNDSTIESVVECATDQFCVFMYGLNFTNVDTSTMAIRNLDQVKVYQTSPCSGGAVPGCDHVGKK